MYYKLTEFEQALQKKYTCEVELVHLKEVQDIIDYYRFTLKDIHRFLIGPYSLGTLDSLRPDHFAFKASLFTMEFMIEEGFHKLCYFTCDDEPEPTSNYPITSVLYALVTPQHNEEKYLKLLHQLEKLRAFL